MSNKLNKKTRAYLIATVISVALVSMGIALAYFAPSIQGIGTASLTTTVSDNPEIVFEALDEGFVIDANVDNFTEGGSHLYDETSSTATLVADSEVTGTYNVYFNISLNEFVYTTVETINEDGTTTEQFPELILVIYVDGEIYEGYTGDTVTYDGITGIDVTTTEGLIQIAFDYSISTDELQEWTAVLYFINLDSNQIENSSKSFSGQFFLGEPLTLSETILINNGAEEGSANSYEDAKAYVKNKDTTDLFSFLATTNEGMYATEDDYGTSYYFRGAVDDNWVIFGEEDGEPIYWRIIRIDGEGNLRMIYSGTTPPTAEESVVMESSGTQITTSTYNGNSSAYVKDANGSSYRIYQTLLGVQYVYTTGELHGNNTSSVIKSLVDEWYTKIKEGTKYSSNVVITTYCNDRTFYTSEDNYEDGYTEDIYYFYGLSSKSYIYGAGYRLVKNKNASLECTDLDDSLELEVGLITADEVVFAGGMYGSGNSSYYLYTGISYWTLTPYYMNAYDGGVFYVGSAGVFQDAHSAHSLGVRPVVSLKSEILNFVGTGTWNDPYEIA